MFLFIIKQNSFSRPFYGDIGRAQFLKSNLPSIYLNPILVFLVSAKRVLLDLSHNEEIESLPDFIFPEDYEFDELEEGPITAEILGEYDLVVIGNPQMGEDKKEFFFTKEEVLDLKKYVARGFGLLLTSGAGGDRDLKRALGSTRVLFTINGVTRFWNGMLQDEEHSVIDPQNLLVDHFTKHWITRGLRSVVFSEATFLDVTDAAKELVQTYETTNFKYSLDDTLDNVGKVPIVTCSEFLKGRTVTLGCSRIFLEDADWGVEVKDNKKFLRNIFSWLLFEDES